MPASLPAAYVAAAGEASCGAVDKEQFPETPGSRRSYPDLVASVRCRGQDAIFIIHIEHQSRPEPDFWQLSSEQLDGFAEAILDFESLDDASAWLAGHQ
jgi:hypothetical protein